MAMSVITVLLLTILILRRVTRPWRHSLARRNALGKVIGDPLKSRQRRMRNTPKPLNDMQRVFSAT